ncbi:UDP-2,3-diacylglucosamine diphosphatase [Pseudoxanthomonas koreensis]|uniref:UDP-2,3-diacylglucosamine diphosphatase n=1 Tax=Pseudoxanthomonas koreensis TaxID=266061 RepID=UPI0013915EEC|nr:UDP-2,3-diacylglucosamine diphosphatase [Pseudoxanthomonas koreensis]KAF1694275.1 UDP-2,3-diacylglucosamine hydrolase [Pseudoxanthomonas koreensis]
MTPAVAKLPERHRAVFLSDVHLGSRHCHAVELADFLAGLRCGQLYLVGDIVDFWWMAQRRAAWGPAQQRVVEALHALARAGTEVIYVPGNHDRPVRRFCGLVLPAMQLRRRAIHATADGRRLLVVHGDDYDGATRWHLPMPTGGEALASTSPIASPEAGDAIAPLTQGGWRRAGRGMQFAFGDWLYYRILTGNRLTNAVRRRLGLRYWSLSDWIKRRSGAAERYIGRFVDAGLEDARRRGLDGIVCGHIHRAGLFERDGLVYANDGDWVESLTALVEDMDGTLRLLTHRGEVLAALPSRAPRAGRLPRVA